MSRTSPFLAAFGGAVLLIGSLSAAPAHAATVVVTTEAELRAALEPCADSDTIELGADIAVDAETAFLPAVQCDLTLELNGHTLESGPINVLEAMRITDAIAGAGSLEAIGGIRVPSGASLTIDGGDITAIGFTFSAGIGGGAFGETGTITVNGGSVVAQSGGNASAGIGGGFFGAGGEVIVTGGFVHAEGDSGMPGIGAGGNNGLHGSTTITGGTVVAPAASTGFNGSFGVLTVSGAGLLSVPSGQLFLNDGFNNRVTIEPGGRMVGEIGNETVGATIEELFFTDENGLPVGGGTVHNGGVIGLAGSLVIAPVEGNDFDVAFDPQDGGAVTSVRLLAPDFASGYRTIPSPPVDTLWNTAPDGSGTWFTEDRLVTGDLTLYAAADPALDVDGDGVPNADDVCPATDPDESTTRPRNLKPNHYWWNGAVLTNGKTLYALAQTGGCTVADIIAAEGLGKGHVRYGLSPAALAAWLADLG